MRLDLVTLRLFVAVINEGSIAKAAKREHITGPAISKRIAELEELLGVRLIERHTRGIKPTTAGLVLATEARTVLGRIAHIHAQLGEYATGTRGEVRLSSGASGLVGQLPEDLRQFILENPLVQLQIKEQHSPEVVKAITDGDADIGIFAPNIPAPQLDVYPYQSIQLVLLASTDHPLAQRRSVSFSEAVASSLIGLAEDSALGQRLATVSAENGINISPQIRVTGHEPLRRLVEAGIGIGILPDVCATPYIEAMHLRAIPLRDSWSRYSLNICTRAHETLAAPVQRLLSHLILRANGQHGSEGHHGQP
ncbi:MAG: LysR family transcriptional regulator [Burkholderiales bacterium]|nr:LysR family transcriptional regulator [Burkholderiales bacterium]